MVIRIAGQNIPADKQLKFALTPIKGIGKNNVLVVLKNLYEQMGKKKLNFKEFCTQKIEVLNEENLVYLRNLIENEYLVEADLRRKVMSDIKRLVDLKTWRGSRHRAGLPVRGQTTRTNNRTRRGNVRRTGSSGKAKAADKT